MAQDWKRDTTSTVVDMEKKAGGRQDIDRWGSWPHEAARAVPEFEQHQFVVEGHLQERCAEVGRIDGSRPRSPWRLPGLLPARTYRRQVEEAPPAVPTGSERTEMQ